eukprot:evm.model.scf_230.1 EVM.evm.TU.scf_230.1   scf_230:55-29919(-)
MCEAVTSKKHIKPLLQYCTMDIDDGSPDSVLQLMGLPLLPLLNGQIVSVSTGKARRVFLPTALEQKLLQQHDDLLIDSEALGQDLWEQLSRIAKTEVLSLARIDVLSMVEVFFPRMFPAKWKGQVEVVCSGEAEEPMWLRALLPLARSAVFQLPQGHCDKLVQGALTRLDCRALNRKCTIPTPVLESHVHSGTVAGILAALKATMQGKAVSGSLRGVFDSKSVTVEERKALRKYLLLGDSLWHLKKNEQHACVDLLRRIPMFQRAGVSAAEGRKGTSNGAQPEFTDLLNRCYLPPEGVDKALLGRDFIEAGDPAEASIMVRHLGVKQLSKVELYKQHVIHRIQELPPATRDRAVRDIIRLAPSLVHDDRSFADEISKVPFVPTSGGGFQAPCNLFDPRNRDLADLLDPATSFPASDLASDNGMLASLQLLGMKTSITPETLLQSANSVQNLAPMDCAAAISRGKALLSYLEVEAGKLRMGSSGRPSKAKDAAAESRCDFWEQMSLIAWSEALMDSLGWSASLAPGIIAQQLLELGKLDLAAGSSSVCKVLAGIVPTIYSKLGELSDKDMEVAKSILSGSLCVWVGNGFAPANKVAFKGSLNLSPWLYVIPIELAPFKDVLLRLGAKESFSSDQYISVLWEIASAVGGQPLEELQLNQCISMVQSLADMEVSCNTHAPDAAGHLVPVSELVYNDTPWLAAPANHRFIHPKLSNQVAQRVGVASLREVMLMQSCDSAFVDLHTVEAFGQSESLTARLQDILESYPDGAGILMELLQNADDAGASEVQFVLDKTKYPTDSILSPRMAMWQGPALCCYNDAVFSEADFANISSIGQHKKLQQLSTTGRFGLGFNSVYHFTDLPSFVSGDFLVFFDPHASHLPGVSHNQPGLKFALSKSNVLHSFPDAFAPYLQWCKLGERYNGTFFRFPLRTAAAAERSDIKKTAYTPEDVNELFRLFGQQAQRALLFLKCVRTVSLVVKEPNGTPRCLLRVALNPSSAGVDPQKRVNAYIRAEGCDSRPALIRKLKRDRKDGLPELCELVQIDVADGEEKRMEHWLIYSALGKGRALDLTLRHSGEGFRLIPWVCIAAPMPGNTPSQAFSGQAFCFLPLPNYTGLPVHVNSYFELSNNRRDLWLGEDMKGSGKLRSEWNTALLEDLLPEAYAKFLGFVATRLGPREEFFRLFPSKAAQRPWDVLMKRLYMAIQDRLVVWTGLENGMWVEPQSALLPDAQVLENEDLLCTLLDDGLPIASRLPAPILDCMLEFTPGSRRLNPTLVRAHFCKEGPHPSLTSVPITKEMETLPDAVQMLLEYCLSDVDTRDPDSVARLAGLPLLPLADCRLQRMVVVGAGGAHAYVADEIEQVLLNCVPGLLVDTRMRPHLWREFLDIAKTGVLNISRIDASTLVREVIPRVLQEDWKGRLVVSWDPSNPAHPSREWVKFLWMWLADSADLSLFEPFPLLPVQGSELCRLNKMSQVLHDGGWTEGVTSAISRLGCRILDSSIVPSYHKTLSSYIFDATALGLLSAITAHDPDGLGPVPRVVDASALTPGEKRQLRTFLMQEKWFKGATDQQSLDKIVELIRCLPVFESHGGASSIADFVALQSNKYLAPDGTSPSLLTADFIKPDSDSERSLLVRHFGVVALDLAAFYKAHVMPGIRDLNATVRDEAMMNLLKDFGTMSKRDPNLVEVLRNTPFVPTKGGQLAAPHQLYDPRKRDLVMLMDSDQCFPVQPYTDSSRVMNALVSLGMHTSTDLKVLLECATSLEASAADDSGTCARAKALLKELDLYARQHQSSQRDKWMWEALAAKAWCPSIPNSPVNGLPWATAVRQLCPPRLVRPKKDMWVVSATMRILDGECSPKLCNALGWSASPKTQVLSAQLLELGKLHQKVVDPFLCASLLQALKSLYSLMTAALSSDEVVIMQTMLEGSNFVWMGSGFVGVSDCAMKMDADFKPYLHQVPAELAEFGGLLRALGVVEAATEVQYAKGLRNLSECKGAEPLNDEELQLALRMAKAAADAKAYRGPIRSMVYLPDASRLMVVSSQLFFNDAPWLEGAELRMIHPEIDNAIAEDMGARSLRYHHQVDTQMTNKLPCASAQDLKQALLNHKDPPIVAIYDLLEVADSCGATRVHVYVDERQFKTQSLLHPGLAPFQGPALCIQIEGLVLSASELCELQSPTTPFHLRGTTCRYGFGLQSCYLVTDLPMIVSGDGFYMWDPTGKLLGVSTSDHAPQGRHYKLVGCDLKDRFQDQFAVWSFAEVDVGKFVNGTLIRLPLRMRDQGITSPICKMVMSQDAVDSMISELSRAATQVLLFSKHLEAISISKWIPDSDALELVHEVHLCEPASKKTFSAQPFGRGKNVNSKNGATKTATFAVVVASGTNRLQQTWLVGASEGVGRHQDKKLAMVGQQHMGAVAVKVADSEGGDIESATGVCCPLPLPTNEGNKELQSLPFLVNARFHLHHNNGRKPVVANVSEETDGRSRLEAAQNMELALSIGVAWLAVADCLLGFRKAAGVYEILPSMSGITSVSSLAGTLCCMIYAEASQRPVWKLHNGSNAKISDGMFLPNSTSDIHTLAETFMKAHFPVFDIPSRLKDDLLSAGVPGIKSVTPATVRFQLRKLLRTGGNFSMGVEESVQLLTFCFSDARACSDSPATSAPSSPGGNRHARKLTSLLSSVRDTMISKMISRRTGDHARSGSESDSGRSTPVGGPSGQDETTGAEGWRMEVVRDCRDLPVPIADGKVTALGSRSLFVWPARCSVQPPSLLKFESNQTHFMHPDAVAILGTLCSDAAVRRMLCLQPLTLPTLAEQIVHEKIGGHGQQPSSHEIVEWRGSGIGGPAWLHRLWELVCDLREQLPAWGLGRHSWVGIEGSHIIPLEGGMLTWITARTHVICPPESAMISFDKWREAIGNPDSDLLNEVPDQVAAVPPDGLQEPWDWLISMLTQAGFPVLDRRFGICREACNPQPAFPDMHGLIQKMHLSTGFQHSKPKLELVDSEVRWRFFLLLTQNVPRQLYADGKKFLRSLPIYRTLDGELVALGDSGSFAACPESAVMGLREDLPQGIKSRLLEHSDTYTSLYSLLDVSTLTTGDFLSGRLLPSFATLDGHRQQCVLQHVLSNWLSLRALTDVTTELGRTPFVTTATGAKMPPADLYDGENQILSRVFHGEPVFPAGEYSSPEWLQVLRECGLQSKITNAVFRECAAKVDQMHRNATPETDLDAIIGLGTILMDYMLSDNDLVPSRNFVSQLAAMSIVPATLGGLPKDPHSKVVLAEFQQIAMFDDWPLVWTVVPVAKEAQQPLRGWISWLGVRSPPLFNTVLEHLHKVGEDDGQHVLANWDPSHGTIEDAFGTVLKYLTEAGLSASQKARLKSAAFIPVANSSRLVPPCMLFTRMREDLSPFLFEVPTQFLSSADLLRDLGARDSPDASSLADVLQGLEERLRGRSMNVNECQAAMRVLQLLTKSLTAGSAREAMDPIRAQGKLLVPTTAAKLVPSTECMYLPGGDSPLVSRVDLSKVHLAHPQLHDDVCGALRITPIHVALQEELDPSWPDFVEVPSIQGLGLRQVSARLQNTAFAGAVHGVLKVFGSALPSLRGMSYRQVRATLSEVAEKMRFVAACHTKVVMRATGADVTGSSAGVYEFTCSGTGAMYIAAPPPAMPLAGVLSQAISRALQLPVRLPLELLLTCAVDDIDACFVATVGGKRPEELNEASAAGECGTPLVPSDRNLLQLKPRKRYQCGELVAVVKHTDGHNARSGKTPMTYARVVEDAAPSVGEALYNVAVETEPGHRQALMSTEVYSFRSGASAEAPDSIALAAARSPDHSPGLSTRSEHSDSVGPPSSFQSSPGPENGEAGTAPVASNSTKML